MYDCYYKDDAEHSLLLAALKRNFAAIVNDISFEQFVLMSQPAFLAGSLLALSLATVSDRFLPGAVDHWTPNDVDIWFFDPLGFEIYQEKDNSDVNSEVISNKEGTESDRGEFLLRYALEMGKDHKLAKIGNFNVIHSHRATSLTALLDSFDIDCVRVGYDTANDLFLVHHKAKEAAVTGHLMIDGNITNFTIYDSFIEAEKPKTKVVEEKTASQKMKGDKKKDIVVDIDIDGEREEKNQEDKEKSNTEANSSICPLSGEIKKETRRPFTKHLNTFTEHVVIVEFVSPDSLSRYPYYSVYQSRVPFVKNKFGGRPCSSLVSEVVLQCIWSTVRDLNIDIQHASCVNQIKELGASFNSSSLKYFVPSHRSILAFAEFLPFELFTWKTRQQWYTHGGVFLITVYDAASFLYLSSQHRNHFLCDEVDQSRMDAQDVCELLMQTSVTRETVFNILLNYYFHGRREEDSKWGNGIVRDVLKDFVAGELLQQFECKISRPLHRFRTAQVRFSHRIGKYMSRGYMIQVSSSYFTINKDLWNLVLRPPVSKNAWKLQLSGLVKDIKQYILTFLPARLYKQWTPGYSSRYYVRNKLEEKIYFYHPVLIDTRIARIMADTLVSSGILDTIFGSDVDKACMKLLPVIFHPSLKNGHGAPARPNVLVLAYSAKPKIPWRRKVYARVHDEETFFVILRKALDDFREWPDQHCLLLMMLAEAEKERQLHSFQRQKTFELWNLIGPVKDLSNFVIYDTFLMKTYIVSISNNLNYYCGKSEEVEVHTCYGGHYGFDCEETL